jgi:hypothetical protein
MNIKELQTRYNITRTPLYSRLKALGFTLGKDSNNCSFATPEQIATLDELNEHLKSGGNLKNFIHSGKITVLSPTEQNTEQNTVVPMEKVAPENSIAQMDYFLQVGEAIASSLRSPLENLKELEMAYQNKWLLEKKVLRNLLNRQKLPKRAFSLYGFTFYPQGKFWQVTKN